jgi:hypothetical protein
LPSITVILQSSTVRSMVLLVFREEKGKSYEDEIKGWQVWRARQHSPKQRILDIGRRLSVCACAKCKHFTDVKTSSGIDGNIAEVGYNAVQFYWMPGEQPVKV